MGRSPGPWQPGRRPANSVDLEQTRRVLELAQRTYPGLQPATPDRDAGGARPDPPLPAQDPRALGCRGPRFAVTGWILTVRRCRAMCIPNMHREHAARDGRGCSEAP